MNNSFNGNFELIRSYKATFSMEATCFYLNSFAINSQMAVLDIGLSMSVIKDFSMVENKIQSYLFFLRNYTSSWTSLAFINNQFSETINYASGALLVINTMKMFRNFFNKRCYYLVLASGNYSISKLSFFENLAKNDSIL